MTGGDEFLRGTGRKDAMMNQTLLMLAMGPAPGGSGSGGGSPLQLPFMLLIMVAIFYFMLIRPQQRRDKERRRLLENVKTGDRVVFGGGLMGLVANVKDKILVIKIADNVKIEVTRGAVTQVLARDEEPAAEDKK